MSRRSNLCIAAACVAAMITPLPAMAASYLWVGGTSGNWGNPAEWNPNTNYPGSGANDAVQFDNMQFSGGGGNIALADVSGLDASFTIGSISKATASGNRNFNLNNVTSGVGQLIFAHSSGTATFTNSNGLQTFTDNFNVGVRLDSNLSLSVGGANLTLRFTKAVTENGGARSIAKAGTGTFVLRAANSYSGGTTITAGKILVDNVGTLGSGDVTLSSTGRLDIQNAAGAINDLADVSLASGAIVNLVGGLNDLVGSLTLGGTLQTSPGTYGAIGSGAANESSYFTGSGVLSIIAVPEPTAIGLSGILACTSLLSRRRHVRV